MQKENSTINKEKLIKEVKQDTKDFVIQFAKFYGFRALLSIAQLVMKRWSKILSLNTLVYLLKALFNTGNLRTGAFLSVMPYLYKVLSKMVYYFQGQEREWTTFLCGFIAGVTGILLGEKSKINNFIILSVMARSLHSMLVVYLKKKGLSTQSKLIGWFVFYLVILVFLFLNFTHPTFTPIAKLYDVYANYSGNERQEQNDMRKVLRII